MPYCAVDFRIAGYYDPGPHAGSLDADLSYQVPISTFCCTLQTDGRTDGRHARSISATCLAKKWCWCQEAFANNRHGDNCMSPVQQQQQQQPARVIYVVQDGNTDQIHLPSVDVGASRQTANYKQTFIPQILLACFVFWLFGFLFGAIALTLARTYVGYSSFNSILYWATLGSRTPLLVLLQLLPRDAVLARYTVEISVYPRIFHGEFSTF